jgi:hypothetical protein
MVLARYHPDIGEKLEVRELKVRLADRGAALEALLTRYKEKWPAVIQARQDIASLRRSLDEECLKGYESILADVKLAEVTEKQLSENLEAKQQTLLKHNRLRIEFDRLDRKATQTKTFTTTCWPACRRPTCRPRTRSTICGWWIRPAAADPVKPKIPVILILNLAAGHRARSRLLRQLPRRFDQEPG